MRRIFITLLAFALLFLLSIAGLSTPAAVAGGPGDQVCSGLDSGKIDTTGDPMTVTVTAPEGKLIDGYCVKGGSAQQGDGPQYVDVPPQESVTFGYTDSDGRAKAVSHYSVSYVDKPVFEPDTEKDYRDVPQAPDCEAGTVTTLHQERTRTETSEGVWGPWSEWQTVDSSTREATAEECPPEIPEQPDPLTGEKTWEGSPDCKTDTVTIFHQAWTQPYVLVDGEWVLGEKVYSDQITTTTRPATEQECPPEPPVDVCPNLEGDQSEVPPGYIFDDETNTCVLIPEPPVDVCDNIPGDQSEVPEGYEVEEVDGEQWCTTGGENPPNCPRVPADSEPCEPSTPEKPVRGQHCEGDTLVVTVTHPNGKVDEYPHSDHQLCADKGIGTPTKKQASPPPGEQVLPNTGGPLWGLAAAGLTALTVGAGMLIGSRRRAARA